MRSLVLVLSLSCFMVANASFSEELTPEKKAAIRQLLQVTGALQMEEMFGSAFAQQMIELLQQLKPGIDPKSFDIIKQESATFIHEELVEKESLYPFLYPIYHRYLTLQETKGLIQFYQTPLGQKAIRIIPKMMQEGMQAGERWGQSIAPKLEKRILYRFKEAGIELQ
ncbi:MAG: DUF2059 domain-containing protein [Deltaproteobacteria bacterium]